MALGAPGASRGLRLVAVVLGVAVALGIVASLLAVAAPTPPKPRAGELIVDLPETLWGLFFLSPLLVGVAALLLRRLTHRGTVIQRTGMLVAVVLLLVAVVFVYVLAAQGSSNASYVGYFHGSPPAGNNSSSPPSPKGSGPGNSSSAPVPGTELIRISGWMAIAGVAGLSAVVAVLAVPGMLSRVFDRRGPTVRVSPTERARAREAVAEAGAAIRQGGDPRETIVRLYLRLLAELQPRVGGIDHLTATEIRAAVLERLGVRPPAARELTTLFEEARYSTHPMGPEAAGRCRDVIALVERDLAHLPVPA
ncbi:MAG TPA: DUF4129 domain-containing protein [Thermoplasmata archaeon]|nr:DUF4129 domain-containing protein [Thermoplasmata archaeon]